MIKYHKIETVFERDMEGTKKLIEGAYRDPLVEFLKDVTWRFTEKIDGTNIGIYWDGHKVHFQGRTEKANIPAFLLDRLIELFGGDKGETLQDRPKGEWVECFDGNEWTWYCTNCETKYYQEDLFMGGSEFPRFCPNCGADMRGDTE